MTDDTRPDPDALLASIQREQAATRRGKLKIFFGMCPGVGKTYAMLQAARQKHAEGVEVLIGVVETHGRKETEALIEKLAICPRMRIEYKGSILEEMDLEAILLWHPPLVIVDELAHTNAPGSRHPKRYLDVLELLEAGINVYTTVNVQHIESRADTVHQITGVQVRETIPDSILDLADEIILVDLTPAQLIARLAEGKVYIGDRATRAAEGFFKGSNLTALREMALRLVAEHVDRDLRELMQTQHIAGPWKTGDRLLVGVSASPFSEKLIRYTRRLAATMEASWIAANIETSAQLSDAEQTRLNRHLTLARRLGAEVVSTSGLRIGEALLRIARQHNVTQIVIGKPQRNARWRLLQRPSPVDWLIEHSGEIDLHMIRSEADLSLGSTAAPAPQAAGQPWREYGVALLIATTVTVAGLLTLEHTGYWAVALIYLLVVMLSATRLQRKPTFFLASLSALLWNFLFIPPRFTFYIREFHDFMMFAAYFVVAIVVGHVTSRLRERELMERRGEERATAMYRVTRALATCAGLDDALKLVVQELKALFNAHATVLLPDADGIKPQRDGTLRLSAKEESVAGWAFQKKQPAGRTTDTLPDADALHLPLLAGDHAMGVLAVQFPGSLSHDQRELLDAIAAQLAIFIEKERAVEHSRATEVAAQSERLQKTLFDTVSHELKTPIAALSATLDQAAPDRAELKQAVRRLTRTVNQLLDATRLESGLLDLTREWCDPTELAREAITLADLEENAVTIQSANDLPPVLVDAGLFEQALSLLLTNAASFQPPGTAIEITIMVHGGHMVFAVLDLGTGLQPGEEERVFEKFYRGAGRPAGGLGLGLSIARRLIEAHGGTITARNRAGRGASFSIRLPLGETMKLPAESA